VKRQDVRYCGIGLNGVDFEDEHAMQLAEIAAAIGIPAERVDLVNDGIVALWGGTVSSAAVIVQHGSGFTAAYRSRHGRERLFDHFNVGAIFNLCTEVLKLVARMIDGRAEPTPLKDKVIEYLGLESEHAYVQALCRRTLPRDKMSHIVPLILDCWRSGDAGACRLVEAAVDDYALAAKAMIEKTGQASPHVVFGGGMIDQSGEQFRSLLAERIKGFNRDVLVKRPDLPPEYGAAIMAAFRTGYEPQDYSTKALKHHTDRTANKKAAT